jgi:hypothetical protein
MYLVQYRKRRSTGHPAPLAWYDWTGVLAGPFLDFEAAKMASRAISIGSMETRVVGLVELEPARLRAGVLRVAVERNRETMDDDELIAIRSAADDELRRRKIREVTNRALVPEDP